MGTFLKRPRTCRKRLNLALFVCGALGVCAGLRAQVPKVARAKPGKLSGEVITVKGAPAPGAQILWQAADGGVPHVLHSDARGHFEIDPLRPGLYQLRASSGGTWSDWEHNVMVRPGGAANVTLRLSFRAPRPVAAANLKGELRSWVVPAPGDSPRAAAVDPKGNVWFTLEESNQIARFDPATGDWKLFDVPTNDSGPRGIVADVAGNIWFTENRAGKIGLWEARSGTISEYTPPSAKDPLTPVIGPDNGLWFTSEISNLIGRLDLETRKITELSVPTQDAHPFGMIAAEDGGLWFTEWTGQKLARLDPETQQIVEFVVPGGDTRPSRLAAVGEAIYFTDSAGGRLLRFNIPDKKFTVWNSPSGPKSEPFGIVADFTGQIWFAESAPVANQLVRFNPGLEIFSVFPMPAPNSAVLN
ncbi:MAG: virginiamycin B lyase family protein, partial [Candidatus Acidiferrales bacterium]